MNEITPIIKEKSTLILSEIQKADRILLHCHPLPDPDSLCSALAMKSGLEQLGKKTTVIRGDSEIPKGFEHFPGVSGVVNKSFSEVELNDFDLFISLDSGSKNMISQDNPPVFPLPIRVVVIDHHATNANYGDINLVDVSSPSTAFVIFQLFKLWDIKIDHDIALNLFMGIYTDTGGFKYPPTDHRVIMAVGELAQIAPDFTNAIFTMENSQSKETIYFQALALSSIETFFDDTVAISTVSNSDMIRKGIPDECIRGISISNILKSVEGWNIGVSMIERKPHDIKVSFRTRDRDKYDVSKIAEAIGGGGHKAAAAAVMNMSLDDAKKLVVDKIKEIYNL